MVTVANHRLIIVIWFIAKSYTHPWRDFANRLHLVLHAEARISVLGNLERNQTGPISVIELLDWCCVCIKRSFCHSKINEVNFGPSLTYIPLRIHMSKQETVSFFQKKNTARSAHRITPRLYTFFFFQRRDKIWITMKSLGSHAVSSQHLLQMAHRNMSIDFSSQLWWWLRYYKNNL